MTNGTALAACMPHSIRSIKKNTPKAFPGNLGRKRGGQNSPTSHAHFVPNVQRLLAANAVNLTFQRASTLAVPGKVIQMWNPVGNSVDILNKFPVRTHPNKKMERQSKRVPFLGPTTILNLCEHPGMYQISFRQGRKQWFGVLNGNYAKVNEAMQ